MRKEQIVFLIVSIALIALFNLILVNSLLEEESNIITGSAVVETKIANLEIGSAIPLFLLNLILLILVIISYKTVLKYQD